MKHNKLSIFLSCSGSTAEFAGVVKSALDGLGCDVFFYWDSTSTNPNPDQEGLDRFRQAATRVDAFVQIIEDKLGWWIENCEKSILPLELDWYENSRSQKVKPGPLIVSVKNDSLPDETKAYINDLNDRMLDPKLTHNRREAIETIVSWVRTLHETPAQALVHGVFDTSIAGEKVDEKVRGALLRDQVFPQKYLYASPIGGMLWRKLKSTDAVIGEVWSRLPTKHGRDPVIQRVVDLLPKNHVLSIMALGCGDGEREARITAQLANWTECLAVQTLLVDASKTLVAEASENFRRHVARYGLTMTFGLVDFEQPDVLSSLREELPMHDPCIVLFLGNTLGNIAIDMFLEYIATALQPNDIFVLEIRMASDNDLAFAEEHQNDDPIPAAGDSRFEFITNPIRFLGLTPRRDQYCYLVRRTKLGCRKTMVYTFSKQDCKDVQGTAFESSIKQGASLRLVDVESFDANEIMNCLRSVGFEIIENKVDEGTHSEIHSTKHKVRMGYIVARRLSSR